MGQSRMNQAFWHGERATLVTVGQRTLTQALTYELTRRTFTVNQMAMYAAKSRFQNSLDVSRNEGVPGSSPGVGSENRCVQRLLAFRLLRRRWLGCS